MSFVIWTDEAAERGIDLGDPFDLFAAFKEIAAVAGKDEVHYPDLFGVPLAGGQEVSPEWLAAVQGQATAFLAKHPNLGGDARAIVEKLTRPGNAPAT